LANSTITIGGTSTALGGTITALTALTDLDMTSGNKTILDGVGSNTITIGTSGTTVNIAGTLTIAGSANTISTTTIQVTDTIISLAGNNTGNAVDIGFYGKYRTNGTDLYTGLVWDGSASKYVLFHANQAAPAATTINTSGTGHAVSTLVANLEGNASGTAATVTGAAQTAITSVGTLTALQVDNININGNTISSTAGTDLLITPLTGQQIVLDGTIIVDAGVVTGATSITSTALVGALTGNSDTTTLATNVNIIANNSTNETVYLGFVDGATGSQSIETDTGLTYNPSTGVITATQFTGAVSGTASTATLATNVNVLANNSTDETTYLGFVDGATGSQSIETDTGLTYNPSTGVLTSTAFVGALTGNATTATALATGRTISASGDITWTSASFDGTANVTSVAAITSDVIINADIKSDAAIVMSKTALVAGTGITLSTNTLNVDVSQTQITAVGIIATGEWRGTDVGVAYGGTGVSSLTANGILVGNGTSAVAVTATMVTKGHLMVGDGSGVPSMLAVGTDDYVLTADDSEGTGVKWAAGGGGGVSLSGSTNNTIVTVVGANSLIGEANLTFDGSTLIHDSAAVTPTANASYARMSIDNTNLISMPTGVAPYVTSLNIEEPNTTLTSGSPATITHCSTLRIAGAPSNADYYGVLSNYAIEIPDHSPSAFIRDAVNHHTVSIGRATLTGAEGWIVTNSASLYIKNAPLDGNNLTVTNGPYAFWVDDGAVRFDDRTFSIGGIAYEFPADNGDADEFLQTDGSGNLSWAASSGGAVSAINDATANELVTIGSTTTELDAEANLVFDGNALYIGGDSSHDEVGKGLVINMGDGDYEPILVFKSADVNHGNTTLTHPDIEVDDFAAFTKTSTLPGHAGGLTLTAINGIGPQTCLSVKTYGGTAGTAHTSSGLGLVAFEVFQTDEANGYVNLPTNGNVFSVRSRTGGATRTKFIIDVEGDVHVDGYYQHNTFDTFDDAHLVRALEIAKNSKDLIRDEWDSFLKYGEDKLVELGILGAKLEDGGLLNVTGLQRLHNGAIWQGYVRQQEMQERIDELEQKLSVIDELEKRLLAIEGA